MKVTLAYGLTGLDIRMPDHTTILMPGELPSLDHEKEKAFHAMAHPTGSPPLRQLVKKTDKVAIVISDITRPTPNHKLVPWIVEHLDFVSPENFVIINGTGSHRGNTREELVTMLGEDVVNRVRVVNNDAFDKNTLSFLGKSSSGAEVFLNKEYCDSDIKIVTGFIEPHFFAGFSGGPKGIMPGVAGIDTILHFHSAAMIGHPNSTWGLLEGNPIQDEAMEIALMSKPDFMLNVTLNGEQNITGFFAGDIIQAHRQGCEFVRKHSMIACPQRFDIVITTNSGYPLDMNLYQCCKGMSAAQRIVKRGGSILMAAECSEGLPEHGNFAKILRMGRTPREVITIINDPAFSMLDQWAAQKQCVTQEWADVLLYSSLTREEVEGALLRYCENIENEINGLLKHYGPSASIAVLPLGPLTIPYVLNE
jgi:lactate racemase